MNTPTFSTFPNTKSGWSTLYEKSANDPKMWLITADRLKNAADILYATVAAGLKTLKEAQTTGQGSKIMILQIEISPIWFFLVGLSFENLIKGICVRLNPAATNGKLRKWPGSGHNLCKLIDVANKSLPKNQQIKLTDDEKLLFERLTSHIEWVGRYPIPKDFEEWMPVPLGGGGGFGQRGHIFGSDTNLIQTLYNALVERYDLA